MKRFFDTCSLLTDCSDLSDVCISSKTIEELENIKTNNNKDSTVKYKARKAAIRQNIDDFLKNYRR